MKNTRKIAIIGGGDSAALLLGHLASAEKHLDIAVDVYDRAGRFARGIAYATPSDAHLLNVRAGNMSAYHTDPGHFALWVAGHGYSLQDFVPRKLYGAYLAEIWRAAEAVFPIRRIIADVTGCRREQAGYVLTAGGETARYDDVIQATGNVLAYAPQAAAGVEGFYADPWTLPVQDLLAARTILLIGSGLTAVDVMMGLIEEGYAGAFTILSRHALLPRAHVDAAVWPDFIGGDFSMPLSRRLRQVRAEAARAAAQGVPWQGVIDSLRPATNPLWQAMTPAMRRQFKRHLLTLWNVHRHRMAPAIAARVDDLRSGNRLHLVKDRVERIDPGPRAVGRKGAYAADAIINCLGYGYQEPGRNYETSFQIGPARFGDWFETTAIPEIRAQASEIAGKIITTRNA